MFMCPILFCTSEELSGFEEVWNGNARKHLPGWSERLRDGMAKNCLSALTSCFYMYSTDY